MVSKSSCKNWGLSRYLTFIVTNGEDCDLHACTILIQLFALQPCKNKNKFSTCVAILLRAATLTSHASSSGNCPWISSLSIPANLWMLSLRFSISGSSSLRSFAHLLRWFVLPVVLPLAVLEAYSCFLKEGLIIRRFLDGEFISS